MKLLSFDPGTVNMGWAALDIYITKKNPTRYTWDYGTIQTPSGWKIQSRLWRLYVEAQRLVVVHDPTMILVEEVYTKPSKGFKTGATVAMAKALVYLLAGQLQKPIDVLQSSTVKKWAVGSGRASKEQVAKGMKDLLLVHRQGEDPFWELPDQDGADAMAVCWAWWNRYDEERKAVEK